MVKERNTDEISIKDFIYLDGDRLYSLYSQVFEGVAESIVKSKLHSESQSGSQKGTPFSGETAQEEFAKAVTMTENTILHDHMYERLEQKLRKSIIKPENITPENFREKLKDTYLIRVKGEAQISDFEQLQKTLEDFNKIGESLAYLQVNDLLSGQSVEEAKQTAKFIEDKAERSKYLQNLNSIGNIKNYAKILGLQKDEKFMQTLASLSERYYSDGFEVQITEEQQDGIVFRGVIDKRWLRIKPKFLRYLFAGHSEFDWIMIGQITHLPSIHSIETVGAEEVSELPESDEVKKQTMRDTFNVMQKAIRDIDKNFLDRNDVVEIIIQPLAIYRESSVLVED